MVLIRVPQRWEIAENSISNEAAFFNRRRFMKSILGAGVAIAATPILSGCQSQAKSSDLDLAAALETLPLDATPNPAFANLDRPLTRRELAGQYNNFYEFGGNKSIWPKAQTLPTEDWKVEVTGLVSNPQTYDLDDLKTKFSLEERRYRFRCVEAWSMAIPWLGFPMKAIIDAVQPKPGAKFVRFISFYDKKITTGPGVYSDFLPWPYVEGLRIEEMANELAFFALGLYGKALPKQHGAPIRAVLPWKYGYKGAKSIVKIEFVAQQPATYWNTIQANEYGFEANVDPKVPHPRWSQAEERFIGKGPGLEWEMRETLPYNGYGENVGGLYA
ncbi:MAG: protein-methionine-sulfoxide reductase catalytic subunit MsrP [Synechococcales cyanobacterium CRU_2_2]|nr:protein-methionine-sulfoxide reductase catalytic subunit MsrP [Synechococcales cyanobacterium CRU_2_2]